MSSLAPHDLNAERREERRISRNDGGVGDTVMSGCRRTGLLLQADLR